jgi:hypothetical protein
MCRLVICLLLATLLSSSTQAGKNRYVTPALEEQTILQVGQLAVLLIPSDHRMRSTVLGVRFCSFTVGDVYRAVGPRLETIVVGPLDVPSGDCISCLALPYFITAISRDAVRGALGRDRTTTIGESSSRENAQPSGHQPIE